MDGLTRPGNHSTPRFAELQSNLRNSAWDAFGFSMMVGAGETYLAAFVLALNMGQITAGLVTSVPMLAGAVMQLISPMMVRHLRSHKKWVVLCALAQAAAFIPLVAAALVGEIHVTAVFALATLYWGAGMATGPAWNTWIGTLLPMRIRAHFLAKRSRGAQLAVLLGVVGGGLILNYGQSHGESTVLRAFAILFAIAGLARFFSSTCLMRQTEPEPPDQNHRMVPARELLSRLRRSHDGRLLLYMLVVQTAVYVSGPYFTPYMLGEMKMSYMHYVLLLATAYSARMLVLPALGRLSRRVGPKRVLWFAGIAMVPLSALWLVSQSLWWLFIVQLTAGAVWAAYELATLLLLFETIPEEERTSVLTTFNLANAVATVSGSAIGALTLNWIGTDYAAYMTVFALSAILRVFTIAMLIPAVRLIPAAAIPEAAIPVPLGVLAVRPNLGAVDRPILTGLPGPGRAGSAPTHNPTTGR